MLLKKLIIIDNQKGSPYVPKKRPITRNGQILHEEMRRKFNVRVSKGNAVRERMNSS
jgi:hypothetical protein